MSTDSTPSTHSGKYKQPPPQSDVKEQLCPICTRCSAELSQGCFTAGGKSHVIGKVNPLRSQQTPALTATLGIPGKFSLVQPQLTRPAWWWRREQAVRWSGDVEWRSCSSKWEQQTPWNDCTLLLGMASGPPRRDFGLITVTSRQPVHVEHLQDTHVPQMSCLCHKSPNTHASSAASLQVSQECRRQRGSVCLRKQTALPAPPV